MTFSPETVAALEAPLDRKHVTNRSQSGRTLSYVEGWHVIAEANRIFGFDGWTRETVEMREVRSPELVKNTNGKETWRVGFIAKVRVTVGGVVREGTGFGAGALPDLGEAYESAIKEAETDAMKRALMTFGNPFGLALYDKTQANVAVDPPKPVAAAEMKRGLEAIEQDLLDCHSLADWSKCVKIWTAIIDRDNWTKDYRDAARPKFAARRSALAAEDTPFSDEPHQVNGDADRNAKDGKPAPVNVLAAG
jgi:DNA repair and recombination protein RAD52